MTLHSLDTSAIPDNKWGPVIPGQSSLDQSSVITINKAAAALDVNPRTVARWVEEGRLESVTLPSGRRRIRLSAVLAILGRAS